jgi:hypothetical protein
MSDKPRCAAGGGMSAHECAPPPELRDRDGSHWISAFIGPVFWDAEYFKWATDEDGGTHYTDCPASWRYIGPVLTPKEVAAKDQALLDAIRKIGKYAQMAGEADGANQTMRREIAAKDAEIARLREALKGAFAAVSTSYDEAQAEFQQQDKRGDRANKIVRAWREAARAALAETEAIGDQ